MDALVGRAIKLVDSKKKSSVPWRFDEKHAQPFYIFENGAWQARHTKTATSAAQENTQRLALYSWNIDFMLPHPDSRMQAAINHLRSLIYTKLEEKSVLNVIFLQECVESDLQLIAADPWIQKHFTLSDLDTSYWQSGHYGTLSLVDRRLSIASCFRVHYSQTIMERDALFSEIALDDGTRVRLCNTHLESLALEPAYRPPQLKLAARWMHESGVAAAVLAGDLNAIQDFDRHLHTDNHLRDAYLELGGREEDPAGHTWGQQAATAQRERFGTSRMDKVFYCGAVKLRSFERFGVDVVLPDETERAEIVGLGFEKAWITDHLGVRAVFDLGSSQ